MVYLGSSLLLQMACMCVLVKEREREREQISETVTGHKKVVWTTGTQLTKICANNLLLMFSLSYEIAILECSLNI